MGLDGVEIVVEIERDFGVQIPDSDASKVVRVSDLHDLVLKQLLAEPDKLEARLNRLVFLHVQTIISEQMGINRQNIRPQSRFIQDLGID